MDSNLAGKVFDESELAVDRPLHLAFLTNGIFPYKVGGIQKHTTNLVRNLARAGVRVDVFVVKDEQHPAESAILEEQFDSSENISISCVPIPKWPYFPGHYYLTCWRQSKCLRDAVLNASPEYDFIFAQGYMGWACARLRRQGHQGIPPVGIHGHGLEALQEGRGLAFSLRNNLAPLWQRNNIGLADANLSLGGRLDDLLITAGAEPSTIVQSPNGIDGDWLGNHTTISRPADLVRFLFVGRDTRRKGFFELNQALESLVNKVDFEFHFVGPVPESRRIKSSKVIYHGEIRDENRLREIYCACSVLVTPSHSEGMPTVILEAMASGLAVIATDVGAVNLLVDEFNGFLIPPRDALALEGAILDAIQIDLTSKQEASRERVEDHTWERVTMRFLDSLCRYLDEVAE
jgi:glycosyltransferase involved in cell wall biosynthesis